MAASLCALVQPSAISALSLDSKINPTPSSALQSHDYHTPDKVDVDMKMDVEVDNKGTVMVTDNEVIKELEEVEVEVGAEVEVENSSNASRFFLPKKSHKEITKSTADNLLTNHSTPHLNDILTTLTTPERSGGQGAMIDRSTKRSREESFSTPNARKSLDQSIARNLNQTPPPTSTTTSSSTPVCDPYVMTPDNLPSFLCNSIPTSKHFHAQVKSTFECLHCGFFREPKMVRSIPVFSFLLIFLPSLLLFFLSFFFFFPLSSFPSFLPSFLSSFFSSLFDSVPPPRIHSTLFSHLISLFLLPPFLTSLFSSAFLFHVHFSVA
jgi:hypothetical protein